MPRGRKVYEGYELWREVERVYDKWQRGMSLQEALFPHPFMGEPCKRKQEQKRRSVVFQEARIVLPDLHTEGMAWCGRSDVMEWSEIGDKLGISPQAALDAYKRGMRKLTRRRGALGELMEAVALASQAKPMGRQEQIEYAMNQRFA